MQNSSLHVRIVFLTSNFQDMADPLCTAAVPWPPCSWRRRRGPLSVASRLCENKSIVKTSVKCIVSDESDKEEVLAQLQRTANLSAVLEVNFSAMMEVVFLCEELSKLDNSLKTRMDTEVVEEIGFWGSLVRGFKVMYM